MNSIVKKLRKGNCSMSLKLYEIDSAIQAIYDKIEANEGVMPDELESQLDGLQIERTTKISNILKLLRNADAEITAYEVEITMLSKKLKAVENRKLSIRNYLAYAIGVGNSFKNETSSVFWKKSESTIVPEVEFLPEQFIRVKTTKEADKIAIKEALLKGEKIAGCEIVEKQTIVIR